MSDQDTQDVDGGTQDGADTDGTQADDAGAQDGTGGSKDGLSPEDARKLRSEARSLRQRLKDAETKLTERDDADLSTTQKAERDKAAAEAERDELTTDNRNLRAEIAAAKVGVRTEALADAVKLLDWDEIDDPTDRKQVEAALKQLVKDKPYLSGRADGLDGGNGRNGNAAGGDSLTDIVLQATGRR